MKFCTNTSNITEGKGETFDFEQADAGFLGQAPGLEAAGFSESEVGVPEPSSNSGVVQNFMPEDDPTQFLGEDTPTDAEPAEQDTQAVDEEGEPNDDDIKTVTDNIRAQMKEHGIEEPEPEPEPSAEDEFDKRIESVQNYSEFADSFKAVMGVDPKQAFTQYRDMVTTTQAMAEEVKNVYSQVSLLKQEMRLRQEWGSDYDTNLQRVRSYYAKLPRTMQAALSDDNGALLIWRSLNGESSIKDRTAPGVVKGRRATSTGQPKLKYSQILAMNDKQYNSPAVQQALATGNFIRDVQV
jgi:hypothetical protein